MQRYFVDKQNKIVLRKAKKTEIGCASWEEAKEVLLERLDIELKKAETDVLLANLRISRTTNMKQPKQ